MQEVDSCRKVKVSDPGWASILMDPKRVRFLLPFLGREITVTAAAEELGCTPNAMLYRVRRMERAGLLEVTRVQARAGRPVRHYRSVAEVFVVPLSVMDFDDLVHRVEKQGGPLARSLTEAYASVLSTSTDHSRVIGRDGDGVAYMTDRVPSRTADGHPVAFSDATVSLDDEQADEVRQLLVRAMEVATTPREATGPRRPYLVTGAVIPLP